MSSEAPRSLILHMSVSFDGFTGRSDGGMDWLTPQGDGVVNHGDHRHQANLEMLSRTGTLVMGRVAGATMAPAWSSSDSPMAKVMNDLPKVIFSKSLTKVDWSNARISDRPLADEINELKSEPGGDIVALGGGHFAQSLIRERLVDEFRLTVHPVAFGEGISLMHGLPKPQRFDLVSSTAYADGCVVQTLRPA